MRTCTRVVPLFAFFLALPLAAAEPPAGTDDLVGPPRFTAVGCDVLEKWTHEYVQRVLEVEEPIVRRMQKRFSMTPFKICLGNPEEVKRLARKAEVLGMNYDMPEKAHDYRLLSLMDDTRARTVRPDGIILALDQRAQIVRETLLLRSMMDAGITSASWTALGPSNVGGRTRAIAVNPATPTRIVIGSVAGGIWKSVNSGGTFTFVNDYAASVAVTCLVHDPVTAATMYACTGESAAGDGIRGFGIFKSTDSGDTWSLLPSTNPSLAPGAANPDPSAFYFVNRLAVHPTTPLTMLAATNRGVFRTTDGGVNWTQTYGTGIPSCSNGRRRAMDIRFDPANGLFAVLGESTYHDCTNFVGGSVAWSGDAGQTWTRVALSGNSRVEIAPAPSSLSGGRTMTWYASNNNTNGQIWKSIDGGQTWTMASNLGHLSGQGSYDNTIVVAPNDANRFMVGGVSMYLSTDGGVNLQRVCGAHVDHHALVADPGYATNGTIYNGNDGGVYRYTGLLTATAVGGVPPPLINNTCVSGITTTNLNNGLAITQFYGGAGGAVPLQRLAGGTQDNGSYVYNYNTATWTAVFGGDGAEGAVDNTDSAFSYGATQYLGVHRQTAGGSAAFSSAAICAGITEADCTFGANPNPQTNFIAPLVLDPNNPNRLYAGAASLWRSDNAKAATPTWAIVKPTLGGTNYISFVAVAPSNSNIAWVGHNSGTLYRSVNATAPVPTWTQVASPAARQVLRIIIDKDDPSRVYLAFGGFTAPNLFLATDATSANPTWVSKHGNLPLAPVRALARHAGNALWLYAGTEVGVFTTMDGGGTWSATNDGPGTVSVEELFFLTPNVLVASTHGRGMFQATVTAPPASAGTIQLATNVGSVAESAGSIALTVTRLGGSSGAASVQFTTGTTGSGAGFATPNVDFTTTSGTLNWANGDSTAQTITIPILNDALAEGNETFALTLSSPTGATLGAVTGATLTIIDPDIFPVNCAIPSGWTTPPTASAGWIVATDQKFEGSCSLKSGPISDGQKAQIQFTGTFLSGNITFRRKVSSENGWDFFRFYVDGVVKTPDCAEGFNCQGAGVLGPTASGETDWNQPAGLLSFPITAGVHTITFSFEKDTSCCIAGADAAWIDLVSLPLPPSGVKRYDFNSDGKPDILFRNNVSGATFVWRMNGIVLQSDQFVTSIDPSWSLIGHGDFNGDGKNDLVWRNNVTGTAYVWYMNDGVFISDAFLFTIDPIWKIEAVADFNNDGKPDFLFRHSTSGLGFVWYYNNTTPLTDQFLYSIDNSWIVENVGDFDGDGYPDFFFRNTVTGLGFIWYWNGTSLGASTFLFGIDPVWQVVQIADWNNDGKVDLVFRNATTGLIFVWYTNGTALQGSDFITQIDPSWKLVPYR